MKIYIWLPIFLALLFSTSVFAGERKLVEGAAPLSHKTYAFTADLGIDYPEPILYGVRFDIGLKDRFQLGVGGGVYPLNQGEVLATVGLFSKFNFWRSSDEKHFVSFLFEPFILPLPDLLYDPDTGQGRTVILYAIRPMLAYEYRTASEHPTGFYAKAGTMHFIGASSKGQFALIGFRTDSSVATFSLGVQHHYGHHFSLGAEPKIYVALSHAGTSETLVTGKIFFSWAF